MRHDQNACFDHVIWSRAANNFTAMMGLGYFNH